MPDEDHPSDPIFSLHRYYLTADTMRRDMRSYLREHPGSSDVNSIEFTQFFAYMSMWYSTLWVVLEGWAELKIEDPDMDQILADDNAALLRRFRNATFHYQRDYFDQRVIDYVQSEDSVGWVYMAHKRVGDALLRELGHSSNANMAGSDAPERT